MKPEPPDHLEPATRKWWTSVVTDYELEPHHERLLTLAGEAWDRAQEARATIAKDGAYYTSRFNEPKAHPALAVERDSRLAFARLLRELALDVESPTYDARPPRVNGARRHAP